MLSDAIAVPLTWASLAGIVISFFALLYFYESGYYRHNNKGEQTAHTLRWITMFILAGTLIYSLISMFANEDTRNQTDIQTSVKNKYGITLTQEQTNKLTQLQGEYDTEDQPIYSTGSTTINGKETIALWRDGEITLLEFKNGSLQELGQK